MFIKKWKQFLLGVEDLSKIYLILRIMVQAKPNLVWLYIIIYMPDCVLIQRLDCCVQLQGYGHSDGSELYWMLSFLHFLYQWSIILSDQTRCVIILLLVVMCYYIVLTISIIWSSAGKVGIYILYCTFRRLTVTVANTVSCNSCIYTVTVPRHTIWTKLAQKVDPGEENSPAALQGLKTTAF